MHNPKYNGQELDKETGYYYYNARYYDPEISRFTTADNVIDGQYSTQGWNRYMYCSGNPIVYKDPTGHGLMSSIYDAAYAWANRGSNSGGSSGSNSSGTQSVDKDIIKSKLQKNNVNSTTKKTGGGLPKPLDNGFVDRGVEFVDIHENENGSRDPVKDKKGGGFGPRDMKNPQLSFHRGLDYKSKVGQSKVGVLSDGKIISSTYHKGYGNLVQVDHGDGVITSYAHLSERNVKVGQTVQKGQVLGVSGNTGDWIESSRTDRDRGEHLHMSIEIVNNGTCKPVNPEKFNWREFEATRQKN